MSCWAVVVAAGRGERAGLGHNKVFEPVRGRTVLARCLDAFQRSGRFDGVALVLCEGDIAAFEALRQRAQGLTASELAAWAEEARFFVNEQFTLEELDWLRKGGRIPSSVAFAGSKLDVKPMMDISLDGKLSLSGVARGRKKAIRQLAEYYKRRTAEIGCGTQVVIGSADCPKDVERLKAEINKVDETVLFLETSIGPVIGSHVGPGMLAIAFMGQDSRDDLSVSDRIAKRVRGA